MLSKYIPYEQSKIGFHFIGLAYIFGFFSSFISAILVDRYRSYKFLLIIFFVGTAIILLVVITWETVYWYTKDAGILVLGAFFGVMAIPTYPNALELGLELSFPVPEEISCCLLNLVSSIWSIIFFSILLWEFPRFNSAITLFTASLSFCLASLLLFAVKPAYKRLFFEKESSINTSIQTRSSLEV